MTLYFGYGSNLNVPDFRAWCRDRGLDGSGLRRLGPAWLPDHEPVFHYRSPTRMQGALSVRPRRGSAVAGALFEVDEAAWVALDRKEGVAGGRYERVGVVALTPDGLAHPAVTYRVTLAYRRDEHVPPTEHYLGLVLEGLSDLGHDLAVMEAAARSLEVPCAPSSVFVYGTLMRGELREPAMQRHEPVAVEEARVGGTLHHLGSYPGLVLEGEGEVRGELFRYRELASLVEELDWIEDFEGYEADGSMYRRHVVRVQTERGLEVAWTYVYLGARRGPVIASGDWRRR